MDCAWPAIADVDELGGNSDGTVPIFPTFGAGFIICPFPAVRVAIICGSDTIVDSSHTPASIMGYPEKAHGPIGRSAGKSSHQWTEVR